MPVVKNSNLPSYERLIAEGHNILSPHRAETQEIRPQHIGILNIMPDGAVEATERQFLRMMNGSSQVAQLHVHFLTLKSFPRSETIAEHIFKYYKDFDDLQNQGLDALIITGTNDANADVMDEPYWQEMYSIMDWAYENVTSTMCSCLATHAAMMHWHGEKHRRLPQKKIGLYEHEKVYRTHPLLHGVNTKFHVPHSRNTEIDREQFERAGAKILVESEEAGVHVATSHDLLRIVYLQGHPEYDTRSLLKEYKRDVDYFMQGILKEYPPFPEHYFTMQSRAILEEYKERVLNGKVTSIESFPETLLEERLFNLWQDSCRSFINNWIGNVYQLTNMDRDKPFMDGIDPDDPFGLKP